MGNQCSACGCQEEPELTMELKNTDRMYRKNKNAPVDVGGHLNDNSHMVDNHQN